MGGAFFEAPVGQRLGASAKSTVGASFMTGRTRVECYDAALPVESKSQRPRC